MTCLNSTSTDGGEKSQQISLPKLFIPVIVSVRDILDFTVFCSPTVNRVIDGKQVLFTQIICHRNVPAESSPDSVLLC